MLRVKKFRKLFKKNEGIISVPLECEHTDNFLYTRNQNTIGVSYVYSDIGHILYNVSVLHVWMNNVCRYLQQLTYKTWSILTTYSENVKFIYRMRRRLCE